MLENKPEAERAVLVGVHRGISEVISDSTEESMDELARLAETAGAEVLGVMTQNRPSPDNATYIGEGKLYELKLTCQNLGANLAIFDDELTGSQLRNIENTLDIKVIDRSALILDIFAQRAMSGEGKLQVELAQLKYSLPRLSGGYSSLSRLGGGIGTRGPGETKLESDRRHIRARIHSLEQDIAEIKRHRDLIRSRRRKNETPVAALVGYTNSGKSTLLNLLTGSLVLEADMLFATLDPTARALTLSDGRQAIIVDTVGFIRKLPHHLIEAFKSTLEEAIEADVIIHVADASSPELENQTRVVKDLLAELGCASKPTLNVFNKIDVGGMFCVREKLPERSVFISAKEKTGIDSLIREMDDIMPGKRSEMTVLIPYAEGSKVNEIRLLDSLIAEEYKENGTLLKFMADAKTYAKYREYLCEEK